MRSSERWSPAPRWCAPSWQADTLGTRAAGRNGGADTRAPIFATRFVRDLYDQKRGRGIQFETRSIPILRVEYPFLSRTVLRAGFQGVGPLPYRSKDRIAGRNSFEQRTAFLTVPNQRWAKEYLQVIESLRAAIPRGDLAVYDRAALVFDGGYTLW